MILALTAMLWGGAYRPIRAAEPARLHEARFTYRVDRSALPAWVTLREVTLVVDVGPALDAVALGDGMPVPCAYDGQRAIVTSRATEIELIVAAPVRSLEQMGAIHLATLRDDKDWALSLTLDDGYVSQATTAKRLLDRYGYDATVAVVGSRIGTTFNGDDYASAAQLQALVRDGWQLSNHTNTHHYAAEMGEEPDVVRNVQAANVAIRAAVPGYTLTMFTSPYVDPAFAPIISDHVSTLGLYLIQSLGWEGRWVDPVLFQASIKPYTIGRTQLLHDGSQFEQAQAWLAANPGKHLWLSLHTHDVAAACDCVEISVDRLYQRYGAGGLDNVWVAPAPEVYQYLIVRDLATVTETSRTFTGQPPAGFSLPTPAPSPTLRVLRLQQGHAGYAGMVDAYIDSYNVGHNYGNQASVLIRTLDRMAALLRFDTSQVPPNAIVQAATLRLYGQTETNASTTCIDAHLLLRSWHEADVTWNQARADEPWGTPGALSPAVDQTAEHSGLRGLAQGVGRWYDVELGQAVQEWVTHPEANHGVVLRGSGLTSRQINLASSESSEAALRPMLIITYTLPVTPEEPIILPEGDGLLIGRVLIEGRGEAPSPSWRIPVTVTLARTTDGVLVYRQRQMTGESGEFRIEDLRPGTYDVTVAGDHALPVTRRGLAVRSGLNMMSIGPLPEGDVVYKGYITARDWSVVTASFGASTGDPAYRVEADLNGDQHVDVLDMALLFSNYGRYGSLVQTSDPGQPIEQPAPAATLRLEPAMAEVEAGQPITYEVMLDTGPHAVDGVDLWVEFDPDHLDLVEAQPGSVFPILFNVSDFSGVGGAIRYAAGNLTAPVTGTVSILQLRFTAGQMTPGGSTALTFGSSPAHPNIVAADNYDVLANAASATLVILPRANLYLPLVRSPGLTDAGYGAAGQGESLLTSRSVIVSAR